MTERLPIVVAEDEAMLRTLAVEMLEECGFDVLAAGDGIEALHFLNTTPNVALLISDVRMPRMNGYMLVESALQFKPNLRIILMTGYAEESPTSVLLARELRMLRKPFDLEMLCTVAKEMTC